MYRDGCFLGLPLAPFLNAQCSAPVFPLRLASGLAAIQETSGRVWVWAWGYGLWIWALLDSLGVIRSCLPVPLSMTHVYICTIHHHCSSIPTPMPTANPQSHFSFSFDRVPSLWCGITRSTTLNKMVFWFIQKAKGSLWAMRFSTIKLMVASSSYFYCHS